MYLLLRLGGEFGVSSNLRTLCAIGGAGKQSSFFNIQWKKQIWNLVFMGGAVIGGYIAVYVIPADQGVNIAESTRSFLKELGIHHSLEANGWRAFLPEELFNFSSPFNISLLVIGGFLVGFGSRYAGGCTSGHAISGLANLQLPSLIAVIGFFIGGLIITWIVFPLILGPG
jgi:uncharacterized membrane protein YedE/YeeE